MKIGYSLNWPPVNGQYGYFMARPIVYLCSVNLFSSDRSRLLGDSDLSRDRKRRSAGQKSGNSINVFAPSDKAPDQYKMRPKTKNTMAVKPAIVSE